VQLVDRDSASDIADASSRNSGGQDPVPAEHRPPDINPT